MARHVVFGLVAVCLLATGMAIAQEGGAEAPEAGAADAQEPKVKVEGMKNPTMLELLQKGGPVMYPLYICSILMVAFAIERGISLRRSKIVPDDVVSLLRSAISAEEGHLDAKSLLVQVRQFDSPIARVATAGLRRSGRPVLEIEKAIEDAGIKEAGEMRRNCRVLSIVASVAPLLGLLGTVLGMIKAFMTVAAREEALGRTELLASGIYQALVTTAAGLTIAIPSLVLYYIFAGRVDKMVNDMDDLSIDLVERMAIKADVA